MACPKRTGSSFAVFSVLSIYFMTTIETILLSITTIIIFFNLQVAKSSSRLRFNNNINDSNNKIYFCTNELRSYMHIVLLF